MLLLTILTLSQLRRYLWLQVPKISKNEETLPEFTHFKDDAQVKLQEQQRLQEKEQERMQIKQMRENLEFNAVKRFRNSPAFTKEKEERATAVLRAYRENLARKTQQQRDSMQARLQSEGEWFNRRLHNQLAKERFIDMNMNISTRADLLQYEKFLEHRMVPLWDCRGSVAKHCMEFREEFILESGEILAAQPMGLLFNVAGPQQPPQYVSALEAATFGYYANVQYEYSTALLERFKLEDPFLLFDNREALPLTLTEAEKMNT